MGVGCGSASLSCSRPCPRIGRNMSLNVTVLLAKSGFLSEGGEGVQVLKLHLFGHCV